MRSLIFSKKTFPIFYSILVVLFFALRASADPKEMIMCKRGKEVRTIRVESGSPKCKTLYSKQGSESIIGQGLNINSCEDIKLRVQKNLESGAWACKSIKESVVSDLTPGEN